MDGMVMQLMWLAIHILEYIIIFVLLIIQEITVWSSCCIVFLIKPFISKYTELQCVYMYDVELS